MPGGGAARLFDDGLNESLLLQSAVRGNEQHIIGASLDRGADVNFFSPGEPSKAFRTPLRAACVEANVQVIRMLLARGASVLAHFAADGWTALHSAADSGQDDVVRLLLVEADELHENMLHDGFSLMHLLAECLSPRLLTAGLDLMAWALRHMPTMDVDAPGKRRGYAEWTPLHIACVRGSAKAAAWLLKAGAKLGSRTGEFHVRSPGANELARGLPGSGAQVASVEAHFNSTGPQWFDEGLLPIHLAAFGGHSHTLLFLHRRGQSINAMTLRHQWTPLMFAVWNGQAPLVREICRLGGREVVNAVDRRGDGSEWTPLALAVACAGPEVVQVLLTYGADPLVRLSAADFPGRAFLLQDEPAEQWSGPDSRISLLHLAIQRGNLEIVRTVLSVLRAAHLSPLCTLTTRAARGEGPVQMADDVCGRQPPAGCPRGAVTGALAQALGHLRAARLQDAPLSEGLDCDPVAFCTAGGWLPAVLAALLHAADPTGGIRGIELLEASPDALGSPSSRAEIFLELLSTGRALLEDRPSASPPVMPHRFPDVSETLASRAIEEFARLCRVGKAERVAYRILHTTLCMACHFNRQKVVRNLLESGLCDPCCRFLRPVECRPLHIASACGFGYLVQLLLEHRADPLESDESSELPVFKLTRFYTQQISDLQAHVADLEAQLHEARATQDRGNGAVLHGSRM